MSSERKLLERSAVDFRYRLVTILISFVYGIFISRALGADGRGVYVFATIVLPNLVFAFANLGLEVCFRVVSGKRPQSLATFHGDALFASFFLTLVASFVFLVLIECGLFSLIPTSIVLLVCFGFFLTIYQGFIFSIMNGAGWIGIRSRMELLLSASLLLGASLPFLFGHTHYLIFIILYYLTFLMVNIVCFVIMIKKSGRVRFRLIPERYKKLVRYSSMAYGSEMAARLRFQVDQVILGHFGGAAILGVYNQAISLARRSLVPSQSVTISAWNLVAQEKKNEAHKFVLKVLIKLLLVNAVLFGIGWFAALLIPLLYGEDFRPAIPLFRILLAGMCFIGASRILPLYFFGNQNKPGIVLIINWVCFVAQLLLIVILSFFITILYAVAIGSTISYFLTGLLMYLAFVIEVRKKK